MTDRNAAMSDEAALEYSELTLRKIVRKGYDGHIEEQLEPLLAEYDRRGERIAELEWALADARVIVTMMGRKLGPPRRPRSPKAHLVDEDE